MRSSLVPVARHVVFVLAAIGGCSPSGVRSGAEQEGGNGNGGDNEGGGGGQAGAVVVDATGGSHAAAGGNGGAPQGGSAGSALAGMSGTGGGSAGQGGLGNHAAGSGGMPVAGPAGALYAWDGFSSAPGDIYGVTNAGVACGPNPDPNNCGFFNIGSASGKGWARGWDQGEHAEASYYAFANTDPMKFMNLATSGNYLLRRQWDLGRELDLKQSAVAPLVQESLIAKAGTVVWVSALIRLDSTAKINDMAAITLHRSGFGYHFYGETAWFAAVFPSHGHSTWGLWVAPGNTDPFPGGEGAVVHASNKAVTKGVAQLVVVKVEISGGSSDKVSLYIDPPSLGGAEPATPDVVAMTGQAARFRAFAIAGLSSDKPAEAFPVSVDEVRMGSTYSAVTPTGSP